MSELVFGKIKIKQHDPRNWTIETLDEVVSKKGNREEWQIQGYYGNIESAFKMLPLKFLNKTQVSTLEEVKKELETFRNDVIAIIKE
jgi:hypothetical protein